MLVASVSKQVSENKGTSGVDRELFPGITPQKQFFCLPNRPNQPPVSLTRIIVGVIREVVSHNFAETQLRQRVGDFDRCPVGPMGDMAYDADPTALRSAIAMDFSASLLRAKR